MAGFKNKKARQGFDRPQASAGVVVDREWRDILPEDIRQGDIVSGMGIVVDTFSSSDCQGEVWIEAGFPEPKEYFLDERVLVKAFVRKDS